MQKVPRTIPLTSSTLKGVADALEGTGSQCLIIASAHTECYLPEVLAQAERILVHFNNSLELDHPPLSGHVILRPRPNEGWHSNYQRFAISVDLLKTHRAEHLMSFLPRKEFIGNGREVYLSRDWHCVDAADAIAELRTTHERDKDGVGYFLPTPVEMIPYEGFTVLSPLSGQFPVFLGARPAITSLSFIDSD